MTVSQASAPDIHELRRLFRAGAFHARNSALIRAVLTSDLDGEWEAQECLLESLLRDPIASAYPPPRSIWRHLCKGILSELDGGRVAEVHDGLYEACVQGAAGKLSEADLDGFDGYRTLEVPSAGHVVLRVAAQIGGAVETGATLWTAGCVLLGLAATGSLDALLAGHVLELGAGTGALGLGLARRGGPVKRVTLTDGQPAVVENLRHNATATAALAALPADVDVRHLEWGTPELEGMSADVIVGTDLVYDPGCLPALAGLLRRLLSPEGAGAAVALLAVTKRSEETVSKLFAALEVASLRWETLQLPESSWQEAASWLPLAHDAQAAAALTGSGLGSVCLWCIRPVLE